MKTGRLFAVMALLFGMMSMSSRAQAQSTWTVCSLGCDYSTIQEAIDSSLVVNGDTLSLGAETFVENITVDKQLSLVGAGVGLTQLVDPDGGFLPILRVLTSAGISDLTVTGGDSTAFPAGIYATLGGGHLEISNVHSHDNHSTNGGAGLYVERGSVKILDSVVESNTGGRGGGIALSTTTAEIVRSVISDNEGFIGGGVLTRSGTTAIIDSEIAGNKATATVAFGGGGGITAYGPTTITNSIVAHNEANGYGGGVLSDAGFNLVAIESSWIHGNAADVGGGVATRSGARMSITNSEVGPANFANRGGGGIGTAGNQSVVITDSTVYGNQSLTYGGGIAVTNGVASVANATVSGNLSGSEGGGMFLCAQGLDCSATLDSVTVTGNVAELSGGGLVVEGDEVVLNNSLLAANTAPSGNDCRGVLGLLGPNLILDQDQCFWSGVTPLIGLDPLLGPLADNGGQTSTHLPQPNSPLIDSGATELSADQRGVSRPQGRADDIGAVEARIGDSDNDGVPDTDDLCDDTIIPDPVVPTSGHLGINRYALIDDDTVFDTTTAQNHEVLYTLEDTAGCNATQIADALELGKSHYDMGITRSVLESWIASLNG